MSRSVALLAALAALACTAAAGAGAPVAAGDVRAAAELYETSHPAPLPRGHARPLPHHRRRARAPRAAAHAE